MSIDDLTPDSAIVARINMTAEALLSVVELIQQRSHLAEAAAFVGEMSSRVSELATAIAEMAHPDDEINAKYRSRMRRESARTLTGVFFFPYDPHADEVRHNDVVAGLVNNCRFNGQVPRHYSVAEHSIKVAAVAEHLAVQEVHAGELSAEHVVLATLVGALHDGHEFILPDVIRPISARLCDVFGMSWRQIKYRVQDVILEAYGLPPIPAEIEAIVKAADEYLLYCELAAFGSASEDLAKHDHQGKAPPPDVVAIISLKQERVDPDRLFELFDSEVRRLVAAVGGVIPEGTAEVYRPPQLPSPSEPWAASATGTPMTEVAQVVESEAARRLRKIVEKQPIPGERPPSPKPKPKGEFMPQLSRPPQTTDVPGGSWQSAVRSATVKVPSQLMNEPEFQGGEVDHSLVTGQELVEEPPAQLDSNGPGQPG